MPVVTDRLSTSVSLFNMLDLVYKIKSYADIRYVIIKTFRFKYNLARLLIVCIRISSTYARDTKQRSVVLYARRDKRVQRNVWRLIVRVQSYKKRPVLRRGVEEVASRLSQTRRLVPADVLTSSSCRRLRRLDVTLLPTSWRLPAVVSVVLTSRVTVLTSNSCRRFRRLDVTRRHLTSRSSPASCSYRHRWRQLVVIAFALCFPRSWRPRRSSGAFRAGSRYS